MSAVDRGGHATTLVFEEAAGAVVRGLQVAVPACTQLRRITIAMTYVCAVSAIALLLMLRWFLTYWVPFRSGGWTGEKPEGRRTWMCAV
ncbi:hypothetical protein, partial [Xanthomonas sp. SHU 308]|uniref:hypothetical protein n=1 Tax=Xanthomonas sp. SHU 308 TaxID=1591201 RepID=UPI001E4CDAFC